MELGKTAMAFEALSTAGRFGQYNSKVLGSKGYLLGKVGRAHEARDVLRTLEDVAREQYLRWRAKLR
jgi:hypothetical protein